MGPLSTVAEGPEASAAKGRVVSHLQHIGRAHSVESEEPLGQLVGQTTRHLELRGEGLEVLYGAAEERDTVGAALG